VEGKKGEMRKPQKGRKEQVKSEIGRNEEMGRMKMIKKERTGKTGTGTTQRLI
jgi:hypothetical protein